MIDIEFHFGRPFAQIALGLIKIYAGNLDYPDWWKSEYSHQIEAWLTGTEYKKVRVKG